MASAIITLRLPRETVERIEALARRRGGTGTCGLSRALELEVADRTGGRAEALRRIQARLRPALAAQGEFLETFSISDEWRTF
jgi:predicted DNA-binding protein